MKFRSPLPPGAMMRIAAILALGWFWIIVLAVIRDLAR